MTRRDGFKHKVERVHIERRWSGSLPAAISLVLCHEGESSIRVGRRSGMIYASDVLMIEAHCRPALMLAGAATCYLIQHHSHLKP